MLLLRLVRWACPGMIRPYVTAPTTTANVPPGAVPWRVKRAAAPRPMSESEARRAQAHPRPFRPPRYESPSKALYRLIVRHYPVSYQRLKKVVFDAKERVPDGPLGKIDDDGKLRKILAEMGKRKKIYRIKKTPPPDVDLTQPLPEQYLSHFCPVLK